MTLPKGISRWVLRTEKCVNIGVNTRGVQKYEIRSTMVQWHKTVDMLQRWTQKGCVLVNKVNKKQGEHNQARGQKVC